MKYSDEPRHYAPKHTHHALTNSNSPGGRYRAGNRPIKSSFGGVTSFATALVGLMSGLRRKGGTQAKKVMVVG